MVSKKLTTDVSTAGLLKTPTYEDDVYDPLKMATATANTNEQSGAVVGNSAGLSAAEQFLSPVGTEGKGNVAGASIMPSGGVAYYVKPFQAPSTTPSGLQSNTFDSANQAFAKGVAGMSDQDLAQWNAQAKEQQERQAKQSEANRQAVLNDPRSMTNMARDRIAGFTTKSELLGQRQARIDTKEANDRMAVQQANALAQMKQQQAGLLGLEQEKGKQEVAKQAEANKGQIGIQGEINKRETEKNQIEAKARELEAQARQLEAQGKVDQAKSVLELAAGERAKADAITAQSKAFQEEQLRLSQERETRMQEAEAKKGLETKPFDKTQARDIISNVNMLGSFLKSNRGSKWGNLGEWEGSDEKAIDKARKMESATGIPAEWSLIDRPELYVVNNPKTPMIVDEGANMMIKFDPISGEWIQSPWSAKQQATQAANTTTMQGPAKQ